MPQRHPLDSDTDVRDVLAGWDDEPVVTVDEAGSQLPRWGLWLVLTISVVATVVLIRRRQPQEGRRSRS